MHSQSYCSATPSTPGGGLQATQSFDEPFEDESPHTSSRSRPFPELDDLHMGDEERAARQSKSSVASVDEDWWPMGRRSWQSSDGSGGDPGKRERGRDPRESARS